MKKVYELKNLCCPNCASKIERAVTALDGVNSCSLSFFTKRLSLDINEGTLQYVLSGMEKAVHRFETDVEIFER